MTLAERLRSIATALELHAMYLDEHGYGATARLLEHRVSQLRANAYYVEDRVVVKPRVEHHPHSDSPQDWYASVSQTLNHGGDSATEATKAIQHYLDNRDGRMLP